MTSLEETLAGFFASRPEVSEGYLFGSRARGEAAAHSDVDVAVYVEEQAAKRYDYEATLVADLMALLGTNDVDVVVLNDASPLLYHRVLRDGVRVASRDLRATTTREGRALSRYCDYVPQLAKIDAAAGPRTRAGEIGR